MIYNITILLKLILLTVLLGLDQIFIYQKILANEQQTINSNENLKLKLLEIINQPYYLIQQLPFYGFIPDNLSTECNNYTDCISTGINIYKINLDNKIEAYIGIRVNQNQTNSITKPILPQENLIDYIIATNNFIYARFRDHIKNQDIIKLIKINQEQKNILFCTTLINVPIATKFFLRANNLVFLYHDAEPQVYKLIYNNQSSQEVLIKKIKINFNKLEQSSTTFPPPSLSWDPVKQLHIASIVSAQHKLNIFEFSLPNDRDILSIKIKYYD